MVEIPDGMKRWHGGDSAPADWDGGPVLLSSGYYAGNGIGGTLIWASFGGIIAYTPTQPPHGGIEQCDRDAAARYAGGSDYEWMKDAETRLARAFAAHRLAAVQPTPVRASTKRLAEDNRHGSLPTDAMCEAAIRTGLVQDDGAAWLIWNVMNDVRLEQGIAL